MARKKEVIQKEWDTADTKLSEAISTAEKKTEKGTIKESDIADVETKYEAWDKLLKESVKKIGDWKKETDKARLDWMRYVNTQDSKVGPRYEKIVKGIRSDGEARIGGVAALEELIGGYKDDLIPKVKKIDGALDAAEDAIKKRDARAALQSHGTALNLLKGVTGGATKSGLKAQALTYAKKNKVTLKDIDLKDSGLTTQYDAVSKGYREASKRADDLDDEIDALSDELANAEPESTKTDKEYLKHLKEVADGYKGVVAFAKAGLAKVKKLNGDIGKVEGILARAVEGTVPSMINAVLRVHKGLEVEYKAVDTHIQKEIRLPTSTWPKLAAEYEIELDDKTKTLLPLTNRAFSLNYQAKASYETGTDRLIAVLEELDGKFPTPQAKQAIAALEA